MDKNNLSKKVGLLLAGCFITFNALGQTTIKGQVVDATGEPVIGASILVKDTKNGAVSDLDGNYKLDNVKDGSVLVFSYLGYRTQEIPVKGNHVINVSLKENDEVLDEVVVVGYAVGSKRTVSGAVDRIKKEDMNKGVVTSPAEGLAVSNAQVPVEASKVNEAVISQVSEPKKVGETPDILTQHVCCSRSKPASRTVKVASENWEL